MTSPGVVFQSRRCHLIAHTIMANLLFQMTSSELNNFLQMMSSGRVFQLEAEKDFNIGTTQGCCTPTQEP